MMEKKQLNHQRKVIKLAEMTNVHVAQVRNTNNVVVNSLFYKGLRKFKSQKNGKK